MSKFSYALLMVAIFLIGCVPPNSEPANENLAFYIVSEEKIASGKFIDTPDFPRVGYISAKPDLIITNLLEVFPEKAADYAIMGDTNGQHTVVPVHQVIALTVTFRPDDAKLFTALTEKSLNKRLLIMLDDKPLSAPKVVVPIEGGGFVIGFFDQATLNKTEDGLKRLIR